jgi:isoleucyl-tRNA synthetase
VHASDWPEPAGHRDDELAERMADARRIVLLGRSARTEAKVKVRQPLRRAMVLHPGRPLDAEVAREVAEELNVRALEHVESLAGLMDWQVVPNFRALGPRLGPRLPDVKRALAEADGAALRRALDEDGAIEVAGVRLEPGDVEVRAVRHPDVAVAQEGGWAVALDLDLDEALRVEGTARELVRALNDLRKERGLAIADRVRVRLAPAAGTRAAAAVDAHGPWIATEVLATDLAATASLDGDDAAVLVVDDERVPATVERVAPS